MTRLAEQEIEDAVKAEALERAERVLRALYDPAHRAPPPHVAAALRALHVEAQKLRGECRSV